MPPPPLPITPDRSGVVITKACLYNFDPLKPHFYIVKLGFTGVYVIFLISAQNHRCGYSLKPPHRGGSNGYHNLCFEQKYENIKTFQFFVVKFSIYLNRCVFVMLFFVSLCDWLLGLVACVLSVWVCLLFLLVSLVGYFVIVVLPAQLLY